MRAILFDLDGTLVDSLDDITSSLNHVLAGLSLPEHAREDVERLVGDGARMLVRRAIPESEAANEDAILDRFRGYYSKHLTDRTRVFDGVHELLAALVERGVPSAVLSNKPHAMTLRIVDELFPDHPFVSVLGHRDSVPQKPDPRAALEIAEGLTGPIGFVGDSPVDMATGIAAGMRPIGVAWGMRSVELLREAGAELILEHPSDLLPLLDDA